MNGWSTCSSRAETRLNWINSVKICQCLTLILCYNFSKNQKSQKGAIYIICYRPEAIWYIQNFKGENDEPCNENLTWMKPMATMLSELCCEISHLSKLWFFPTFEPRITAIWKFLAVSNLAILHCSAIQIQQITLLIVASELAFYMV